MHDIEQHVYHVMSGNWIYHFLKLTKPIFLIHRECIRSIRTPTTFNLGLFQQFKVKRILPGQYIARIVAIQNDTLIPLSHIQVCNQHYTHHITDTDTRTATCPMPAVIPSRLYPIHALYQAAVHNTIETNPDSIFLPVNAQPQSVTPLPSIPLTDDITHLNRKDVWVS